MLHVSPSGLVALSTWLAPTLLEHCTESPARQHLPILIQHGTRDELVQVERARQSVETLRPYRMPLAYREYDMGHEIKAQNLVDLSAWLAEKVGIGA
ncbi:Carboxylesterase 2 [Candidatus Entotheonellaceae bacterium PAL068K]